MAESKSDDDDLGFRSPRGGRLSMPSILNPVDPIQRALRFDNASQGARSFAQPQVTPAKRPATASPTRDLPATPSASIANQDHRRATRQQTADATPRRSSRTPVRQSASTPSSGEAQDVPCLPRRSPRVPSPMRAAPTPRKLGRPPDDIWCFFHVVGSGPKKAALCTFCNQRINNPRPGGSLLTHVLRHCKKIPSEIKRDLERSTHDTAPAAAPAPSMQISEPAVQARAALVDQDTLNLLLLQLVVVCALPFAILDSRVFKEFVEMLAPGLTVPPRQYFTKVVLQSAQMQMHHLVIDKINEQKFVSVVTDGWTDPNGAKIVNFMVVAPEMPSLFWKSWATGADEQSAEKMAEMLKCVIDDIHEQTSARVVGIVTDNASSMLSAWRSRKFSLSRLAIVGGGCAAHVLNLLMKDLFKYEVLAKVSSNAVTITRFVRDHLALLDTFRGILEVNRANGKHRAGLTLPVPTRWYSVFNCLANVYENRDVLEEIFTSSHYTKLRKRYTKRKASREKLAYVTELIRDPLFWENLRVVVRLIRPIREVLGKLESDTEYASGVYKWFRTLLNHEFYRARATPSPAADAAITARDDEPVELVDDEAVDDDEPPDVSDTATYKAFTPIAPDVLESLFREKIPERWTYVHTNAMGIAFLLDPRESLDDFENGDERVVRDAAAKFALETNLIKESDVAALKSQLFEFARVKRREKDMQNTSPKSYWDSVSREFPLVGKIADIVFAIPPSSAASERAWSIFNHIHTKKRNRLAVDKVEMLVYIYINYGALKRENVDLARHMSKPESIDHSTA